MTQPTRPPSPLTEPAFGDGDTDGEAEADTEPEADAEPDAEHEADDALGADSPAPCDTRRRNRAKVSRLSLYYSC
jgi:hypothetical protein